MNVTEEELEIFSRQLILKDFKEEKFNELQKKAVDAPVINQKKIDELKKAISSGDYKINPEKLAASIANFEFKLV